MEPLKSNNFKFQLQDCVNIFGLLNKIYLQSNLQTLFLLVKLLSLGSVRNKWGYKHHLSYAHQLASTNKPMSMAVCLIYSFHVLLCTYKTLSWSLDPQMEPTAQYNYNVRGRRRFFGQNGS